MRLLDTGGDIHIIVILRVPTSKNINIFILFFQSTKIY